jgi:hypothetical protein
MKKLFLLALLGSLVFMSCRQVFGKKIRGNGNVKTDVRTVSSDFSKVDVSGAIDLYVSHSETRSIKIETDENLLEFIETIQDGDRLIIRPEKGVNLKPRNTIKVFVSSPDFTYFEVSGACDIYSENKILSSSEIVIDLSGSCKADLELNTPKLMVDASGSSHIILKGETKDFSVDGSGSTNVRSAELMAENVSLEISGAGSAEVFASVSLDVDISGAASVKYRGSPKVNQKISGAGSVKKVD